MKVKPSSMFQKNYFLVYEEEKKPLVLFPLYLKKNKLHLFGDNISGAGHLDLLYDEAITTKQFENAFSALKSMFPGNTLELRMINERSKLFKFLKGMTRNLQTEDLWRESLQGNIIRLRKQKLKNVRKFLKNFSEQSGKIHSSNRHSNVIMAGIFMSVIISMQISTVYFLMLRKSE